VSMTNSIDRVEIITSVQRRRRWTASEKVRIVEETFEPGMTVYRTGFLVPIVAIIRARLQRTVLWAWCR
jgi:transposase-like protein